MRNIEKRIRIISTFQRLQCATPNRKKYAIIKEVAEKTGYILDRKNGSSSYVMRVIREWGEDPN